MRRALVIGKFYPPHLGHKFLIDVASTNSDQVDVLVCERLDQTIPGSLRVKWIREMCPKVNVWQVEDIYDDDNSERWAMYVRSLLGRTPEVVFSSEAYGERFAHFLGCEHVLVDKARNAVPVSGTVVREHPLRYWEYLAPSVRAYYAKRVCVLGAESTGTTTMAEALAGYFETVWVPEYGREYAEAKLPRIDVTDTPAYEWTSEEFEHIATEQAKREDRLAREANRILICDTDALATSVWHERYMGSRSTVVEEFAAKRKYDLYLLTDCDIAFVQDGTRDGETVREWMTRLLADRLDERGVQWLMLNGDHEERLKKAVEACSNLL